MGFESVHMKGEPLKFHKSLNHMLWKIYYLKLVILLNFMRKLQLKQPKLHPLVKNKIDDIERIEIATHESAIRYFKGWRIE